ncbi:MAG: diacylglycerol kinase family lipid kinase, partial [Bacteroidia bacterium]|nr:diacylglycerol kinase family lipid kinase [Bacteroidia bacterium]
MNRWVFIVNPVAGNGFAKRYVPTLEAMLKNYGVDADIIYTEHAGHATDLAKASAAKGYKYIIGVGGDGTMNEIARPLVGRKGFVVGLIPAGTGNDFIQILGFPNRFDDSHWKIFFDKHTIHMDVGSCNGKYFLNGMGLGFDAQVAAENYTVPGRVKPGGKNKYIWHIVKTLLFFKEKQMTVISGAQKSKSTCFMNTVSIGRRFAGGFFITPKAIANDGLLDVCNVKKLNLIQRFRILLMVPKGTHITNPKVNYHQTDKISIQFDNKVPFHVDGELNFAQKFDIRILPGALNIIYNPEG